MVPPGPLRHVPGPAAITDDGKAKLVVFVAHWCPHCQREVPVLVRWLQDGKLPTSVSLYVVSTAVDRERPNWPPSTWLREAGLTAPVLADDAEGSAAGAYGVSAFPFFTTVDADGKVVARDSGELTPDQLDQLAAALPPSAADPPARAVPARTGGVVAPGDVLSSGANVANVAGSSRSFSNPPNSE